jgi:hypothetical protein
MVIVGMMEKRFRMKFAPCLLVLAAYCSAAFGEEGGGHAEHKPPPAPSKGTPVGDVYNLPVVAKWSRWLESNNRRIAIWGESIDTVEGQKCSRIAVGQSFTGGVTSVWKHFCVPQMGGDILVESKETPKSEAAYLPYDKWVEKCKPTDSSGGNC